MPMSATYDTINGQIRAHKDVLGVVLYEPDALGSVTCVRNDSLVQHARYKPYGQGDMPTIAHWGWMGAWGYKPYSVNEPTHYVRSRDYDSKMGTWLSIDPYWPESTALAYTQNPVTLGDPSGRIPITLELNAFIPKHLGMWLPEPFPYGLIWEYLGDYRTFNQPGRSRIGTSFTIDSCGVGDAGTFVNNTGLSHRRVIGFTQVFPKASKNLQNRKDTWGRKQIGGPCFTFFHGVVESAYPWIPSIAPTHVAMKGWVTVVGRRTLNFNFGISHSPFPDFELLLKIKGGSNLQYGFATEYPNWILIFGGAILNYFNFNVSNVPTEVCCSETPCCDGECV